MTRDPSGRSPCDERDQIVVVGASLAGLRGAEALRRGGHAGPLTIVGDEPYRPYDRPPYRSGASPRGPEILGITIDAIA